MKLLVLGDDGRAHAVVWKLFNSTQATDIICASGNGGTSQLVPQIDLAVEKVTEIAHWVFQEQVDVMVPASSEALYAGLVDESLALRLGIFGPPQRSTWIERSRCYAKEFLLRHALPTARGQVFSKFTTAEKYLAAHPMPVVVKADDPELSDSIYYDRYTALNELRDLFATLPSSKGNGVVIEEFLPGIPVSFSAITDGQTAIPLLPVRLYDHFQEQDATTFAPGLGAHTGISAYAHKLTEYMHQRLIMPLVAALARDTLPYWGIIGIDCIITSQGPRIMGMRCSMRDMEAQVVLPRLEDDLITIIQAAITHNLFQLPPLRWRNEPSIGIGLVAQGYPHHFPIGSTIEGLADIEPGVLIFHDQTHNPFGLAYKPVIHRGPDALSKLLMGAEVPTTITTTGGHVMTVVALGATLQEARQRAIRNAQRITFAGRQYRADIGLREFL